VDLVAVVVRPESVDVLVGVGEEVMGTHVQVVEVVALEDWLGLAVVVLLALAVPIPGRTRRWSNAPDSGRAGPRAADAQYRRIRTCGAPQLPCP
jgi:hypothetical protein